jgi:hypothetical protein
MGGANTGHFNKDEEANQQSYGLEDSPRNHVYQKCYKIQIIVLHTNQQYSNT